MIKKAIGRPVRGENFFNREKEIKRLWNCLDTDNLLLLAPRRVGKTSLMLHLEDTAHEHDFQAAYFSVAQDNTESEFIRRLYETVNNLESGRSIIQKIGISSKFIRKKF